MTVTTGSTLRDQIVAEALRVTTTQGWPAVTMQALADAVGVSRQTIYNEVGGKKELAKTLILSELDHFLAAVNDAFDDNPTDVVAAIRDAVEAVLELANDNALLRAAVSASHGADTDLLPLLTSHSGTLLAAAKAVVIERVEEYDLDLDRDELVAAVDVVVRTVLSHVMQPSGQPASTAADLAWIAHRVLRRGAA